MAWHGIFWNVYLCCEGTRLEIEVLFVLFSAQDSLNVLTLPPIDPLMLDVFTVRFPIWHEIHPRNIM